MFTRTRIISRLHYLVYGFTSLDMAFDMLMFEDVPVILGVVKYGILNQRFKCNDSSFSFLRVNPLMSNCDDSAIGLLVIYKKSRNMKSKCNIA